MKAVLAKVSLLLAFIVIAYNTNAQIPYGDNKEAGKYMQINGVRHYYEEYGTGIPLLLIHGNSTGIKGWAAQISYFSKNYRVIAIDCRGRGKSDLGNDSLSYLQTAMDMTVFIRQLKLDSVYVAGKSDGGIIAILMGIYYPQHISKIVAFGANMEPDATALYPAVVAAIHRERVNAERMLAKKDTTQNWLLIRQRNRMMEFQPHITAQDLHKINVPVLVMSCDRDLIQEEHTFFIYKNIPKANLCILNDETHHVAKENPGLFNEMVENFLSQPFKDNSYRFK